MVDLNNSATDPDDWDELADQVDRAALSWDATPSGSDGRLSLCGTTYPWRPRLCLFFQSSTSSASWGEVAWGSCTRPDVSLRVNWSP